jgi:hypothetical protein
MLVDRHIASIDHCSQPVCDIAAAYLTQIARPRSS